MVTTSTGVTYHVGDRYWIADEDHAWVVGTLRVADDVLEFSTETLGNKRFPRKELLKHPLDPCGSHIDDYVDNLVDLDELSEGAILHHVRARFLKRVIYTSVGSILVAVNPFENLDIYSELEMRRATDTTTQYPHVFVTASTAYKQLIENRKNQSVLISGESGAGKTETTKKVLAYLANVAPDSKPKQPGEPGVETKILQSNPLLEALGNAKTLRNNNSSRFGKWMKVGFDSSFRIQGCEIINYLLEKSRVVSQSTDERNYHIFYQIIAGADTAMRTRLKLKTPHEYNYLNQSGCLQIKGVDDAMEFKDVLDAMQTLQFSASTVESLLKILAGVLLLGNILFEASNGDEETAKLSLPSEETMRDCAELLGLDATMFNYSLTNKRVQMGRGSVVSMKLSVSQALDARDTLSKSLYSNLFDWVIQRVNTTLKTEHSPYSIGILDIFGFEVFELNSFEQLCINYANEKLQFHFNEVIFSEEMKMYGEENVPLDAIVFEDNGECVSLIEGKPFGVLALLEEECSLGNGTDLTFINKLEKTFGTGKAHANKFFVKHKTRPEAFTVVHFAGGVEYDVNHFLDKNRDNMSVTSKEVMLSSELSLVSELFRERAADDGSGGNAGSTAAAAAKPAKRGSSSSGSSGGASGAGSSATKSTLGGQFRNQLIGLIANLRLTEPHFIRCVKPNHEKVGGKFDGHLALRQLRYAGLFEAIRIRKSGFAYRANYKVFANSYQLIVAGLAMQREKRVLSDQDACLRILQQMTAQEKLSRSDWQIGAKSKVFLKTNHNRVVLERERNTRVAGFAVKIQHMFRKALVRIRRERERKIEAKELLIKQKALQKDSLAAIVVQKYWRRKAVRILMKSMSKFIELRRVLLRKETHRVKEILSRIEADLPPDLRGTTSTATHTARERETTPSSLLSRKERERERAREEAKLAQQHVVWQLFAHEIKVARVMLRVMDVQDELLVSLRDALETNNVRELNRLVLKAHRLEMDAHPLVLAARERVQRLFRKQQVFKQLLRFVKHEEDFHEGIAALLDEAESLQINEEFVSKVRTIYENAGPRWKTRNALRKCVESVDRYGVEQYALEVLQIRKQHSKFAEMELRASRMMLKMLALDDQLFPPSESESEREIERDAQELPEEDERENEKKERDRETEREGAMLWGRRTLSAPSGARLSPLLLDLCERITLTTSASAAKAYKQRLQSLCDGSLQRVYAAIRCFKWSRALCVWNFPEVRALERERHPEPVAVAVERERERERESAFSPARGVKGLGSIFGPSALLGEESEDRALHTPRRYNSASALFSPTTTRENGRERDWERESEIDDDAITTNSAFDEDADREEFFGLRFRDARANPYLIRSLHQEFDMFQQRTNNGEMEAAIGNIALSQSIEDTLRDLDGILDVDLKIELPNGSTFEKTVKRSAGVTPSPQIKKTSALGSPVTPSATMASTTPMKSSLSRRAAKSTVGTTLFSPNTGFSTTSGSLKETRKTPLPNMPVKRIHELPESSLEKQLLVSREKKKAELAKISKDVDKLKRTSTRGWK